MDVIVVQSEGAILFLSLELVLLEAFVGADVSYNSPVGIIVRHLLDCAVLVHDHAVIPHVVTHVVMPTIDCAIRIECRVATVEQVH